MLVATCQFPIATEAVNLSNQKQKEMDLTDNGQPFSQIRLPVSHDEP